MEKIETRYLGRRIVARAIDIGIVWALSGFMSNGGSAYSLYIIYNLLFCFLGGLTFGRLVSGLKIDTKNFGLLRCLWREVLVYLLWWVIFFELFFSTKYFVHERFSHAPLELRK